MATNNISVEFPCGLKIIVHNKSIWLHTLDSFEDIKECPLHGKDCKNNIDKRIIINNGKTK
jgi:hypothetical protein